MILRISPDHRSRLLQWYDEKLFSASTESTSARISTASQNGYGDVDDLIDQLNCAGVTGISSSSSTPPGLATVPSSPTSNIAVEDETRTIPNAEPVFVGSVEVGTEDSQPKSRGKRGVRARRVAQTRSRAPKA